MKVDPSKLVVMLPDTRGVTISRWGKGNLKIGANVVTYSKLAVNTCPGASEWCKQHCYAQRITGHVKDVYVNNTCLGCLIPYELPEGTKLVRIHVSGDFDTASYIQAWIDLVKRYPQVRFWGYTRSWRIPELRPHLEELKKQPNVHLFASTDESITEPIPVGWRVAWIQGDPRIKTHGLYPFTCAEETGEKPDCVRCGYCFTDKSGDVVFLKH